VRHGARTSDGVEVRFTRKGNSVYAFYFGRPKTLEVPGVWAESGTRVERVGAPGALQWAQKGRDLAVSGEVPPGSYAFALKITPVPWQLAKE
jgi:hypothetical protein